MDITDLIERHGHAVIALNAAAHRPADDPVLLAAGAAVFDALEAMLGAELRTFDDVTALLDYAATIDPEGTSYGWHASICTAASEAIYRLRGH
jgi:hypothetical protein